MTVFCQIKPTTELSLLSRWQSEASHKRNFSKRSILCCKLQYALSSLCHFTYSLWLRCHFKSYWLPPVAPAYSACCHLVLRVFPNSRIFSAFKLTDVRYDSNCYINKERRICKTDWGWQAISMPIIFHCWRKLKCRLGGPTAPLVESRWYCNLHTV